MKKIVMIVLLGLLLALTQSVNAEVKIALDSKSDLKESGTYVWAHTFSEHLKANGISTRFFPRDALGNEEEKLDQVTQGLLEVSLSDISMSGRYNKLAYGATLPFLFEDFFHLDRVLDSSDIMNQINSKLTTHGVRLVSYISIGPEDGFCTTKKPIHQLSDFSGVRMRAMNKEDLDKYKAFGASGTIVAWGEIANALQTGIAEGYSNPPFVPVMFGHQDFIKYFTNARINLSARTVIVSENWYGGLSPEHRKIVDEAVQSANKANREWLKTQEQVQLDSLRKVGIEVIELTPDRKKEFVEASKQVYKKGVMSSEEIQAWKVVVDKTRTK